MKKSKRELHKKLREACMAGDITLVKQLYDEGADILADENREYESYPMPVHIAITQNNLELLVYLIDLKYVPSLDDIELALQRKQYHMAKLLLSAQFPGLNFSKFSDELLNLKILNYIESVENTDANNIRYLLLLLRNNVSKKLIQWMKNDIFTLTEEEIKALSCVPDVLSYIDEDMGNTLLLKAILWDKTDIAKWLIEWDISKKSFDIASCCYMAKNSPLILAAKRGNQEIGIELILAGADVNQIDFRRFTALHWACMLRMNTLIEFLLNHGANPAIKNAFGKTPLDYYQADISAKDLSFYPSYASYESIPNEMRLLPMSYKGVCIKRMLDISYGERDAHCFSTKLPDFSDIYWHYKGIFKNMGISEPNVPFSPNAKDNGDGPRFNILMKAIADYRKQIPIDEALRLQMTVSVLSKSTDVAKVLAKSLSVITNLNSSDKDVSANTPSVMTLTH